MDVSDSFSRLFVSELSSQTGFSTPQAAVPTVMSSHSSLDGCSTGKSLLRATKTMNETPNPVKKDSS